MAGARRWLSRAAFGAYLVMLVWVILFKASGVTWLSVFDARYRVAAEAAPAINWLPSFNARETLLNVLAFLPLGYFLMLFNRRLPVSALLLIILGLSLCFEALQYALRIGTPDVTDLLSNFLGGLLGLLLFGLMKGLLQQRAEAICAWTAILGTALAGAAVLWISRF